MYRLSGGLAADGIEPIGPSLSQINVLSGSETIAPTPSQTNAPHGFEICEPSLSETQAPSPQSQTSGADPANKRRYDAGKNNRSKLPYNHTSGSRSFPTAMSIAVKENGGLLPDLLKANKRLMRIS
ncbi:hypothetical protein LOK49_LG05G03589 [Camellia lanceoleosa]|uniref:Uncharacterized protein n=1 Tax=Camellia lanceoleosa TaxID=1840588 RepID=A0ACC0HQV5_9ERIC|nr:hypothetical protein LOK49_LG05G03589 [Camellia lanceoleosa]